jgi:hypothetical protein
MTDEPAARSRRTGPLVVAGVSVLWFAGTLWFTHTAALNAADPSIALIDAALALPLVIVAGLIAGAAVGAVAVERLAARRRTVRGVSQGDDGSDDDADSDDDEATAPSRLTRTRWAMLAGAGIGLVLGAVAGGLVLLGYGTAPALVSLSIAIAAAAALGGSLGGVPWPAIVVAGLAGSLVRFLLGLIEGLFSGRLREALATDDSVAAQYAAIGRVSFFMALIGGTIAGLTASWYLRRSDRGLTWPAHLAAGAIPGLLLLAADVLTRVGGGPLLRLATGDDLADRIALDLVGQSRLSTALVVLFTGAIVAILSHGRTLGTTPEPAPARKGRTTPARGPRRRRR